MSETVTVELELPTDALQSLHGAVNAEIISLKDYDTDIFDAQIRELIQVRSTLYTAECCVRGYRPLTDGGDTNDDDHPPVTVTCENCSEEYRPSDASWITIRGPGDVFLGCPNCGQGNRGPHPTEVKDYSDDKTE